MAYYHVSHRNLAIDTILTQGIYGERIRRHDFIEMEYACYIKEEIFEAIRVQHYPKLPSRLSGVFLFNELSIAKEFYANMGGYQGYVFEVEIIEGEPLVVEMDLLHCNGCSYEQINDCAHKYWKQIQHPNSGTLEVLLNGRAKVKKLLLEPSNIWDL